MGDAMLIKDKNDLPEYFDINKYKLFESLDDREFFNQLLLRHYMVADYDEWMDENDLKIIMSKPVDERIYSEDAFAGVDFIDTDESNSKELSMKRLNSTMIIQPLQRHDAFKISHSKNIFDNHDESNSIELGDSINLIDDFENDFFLKIDLRYPDDFLIDDFSSLLSSWRKKLNIPDPKNEVAVNSWSIAKSKVIRYGIFPYADLFCWQKITGNKITDNVIANTIFPSGTVGEKKLNETIKPFFEKNLANFSLEKFEREIRNRLIEQKNRCKK